MGGLPDLIKSSQQDGNNKMEDSIYLVIDIGGSSTRLAFFTQEGLRKTHYVKIYSLRELFAAIKNLTSVIPEAVAIAVPGLIRNKEVLISQNAPWLIGNSAEIISRELNLRKDKIFIINDGEAHALALKTIPNIKFGAINFALGTGVGFGVLDVNGNILRSLSGDSFEIGCNQLVTRNPEKEAWILLGNEGLQEQRRKKDVNGYQYYGWRLGNFISQLALTFRPKTIGLSGGIVNLYWEHIKEGFHEELSNRLEPCKHFFTIPEVVISNYENSALVGLCTLFNDK
jgi:predicted NBD/HSP70 family sugar kinase